MSNTRWIVSVDTDGRPWVIQIVRDSRIGPFRDMAQAEAAREELAAAAKKGVKQ